MIISWVMLYSSPNCQLVSNWKLWRTPLRVLVIDDQEKILEYVEDILIDISPDIDVVSRTSWASVEPVLEKNADFDFVQLVS